MATKLNIKKYYAPTPKSMRKLGDSLLFLSLGLQPLTLTLPLTDNARLWVNFGLSAAGIFAKAITNFFEETER